MATMTSTRPTAKVRFPIQSIDARTRTPRSSSLRYPQTVPKIPKGTDTKNTSRQSIEARTPPTTRPRNLPAMLATLLTPIASPL